jgi:DNA-binding protein H-NS
VKDSQLEKMTIKELRDLRQQVDALIIEKQKTERAELKEKLAALAAESGFSLHDLVDGRKSKKGPAGIKFRDPKNPNNTWAGRGRKPKWLAGAKDVEKFRV